MTLKYKLRTRVLSAFEPIPTKDEHPAGTTNWRPVYARAAVAICVSDIIDFLAQQGYGEAAIALRDEYNRVEVDNG